MALYIANATKQHHRIAFRLPENDKLFYVEIPSGRQEVVGKGWNKDHMEAVIAHLHRFGARPAPEVKGRIKDFDGLMYRFDKPILEGDIVLGHDAVVEKQQRRSAAQATKSALAFDRSTNKTKGKRVARVTEVSVKEDLPRNKKPTGDEIDMTLTVDPEGRSDAKLPE